MLFYYILIQSRLENPHVPIKCPIQLYYVLPGHHVKISTYSTEYWNFSDSDFEPVGKLRLDFRFLKIPNWRIL